MQRNRSFQLQRHGFIEALENRTFLSAGDLDPTFSGNGKASFNFGEGISVRARDLALQSDGKTVVVGSSSTDEFAVARYNVDGTPDTTFGPNGNGTVLTHLGSSEDFAFANAVAIQPDGKIVAAGGADSGLTFALARYLPDGS